MLRVGLTGGIGAGKSSARRLRRARTLLLADEGKTDVEIAAALHIGSATVARTRQRFAREGLEAALSERDRPGGEKKLSPKQEAHLIALACSAPPKGKKRWTLRLLAGQMVELEHAESLSHEAVRQALKKTRVAKFP